MIDLNKIKEGDIFSEESHYVAKYFKPTGVIFTHLESGEEVSLNNNYITGLLQSSDQFTKTVEVTREDSKNGERLGIRSIFEKIHSSEVFTVVFTKQGKDKSATAYNKELAEQRDTAIQMIDKAQKQKKSMADAYKEALSFIQNNPINKEVEGEDRTLRGYKVQFVSRDGKYNCVDVDLKMKGENSVRLVNINTIKELIVGGTKYIVK